MPEEVKESCNNCGYERDSECHRYPPTIQHIHIPRDGENEPSTDTQMMWPSVSTYAGSDSWCGEWKHPSEFVKVALANGA